MASIPLKRSTTNQSSPYTPIVAAGFAAVSVLLLFRTSWARSWVISGAPLLTCSLIGAGKNRVFPFIPLWTSIAYINVTYALASTSWLFYWGFTAACYPSIFITGLFHFDILADFARRTLRKILRDLQFTSDKISFFDLPALEIDRDVDGLMVIRGVSISVSTLTLLVHGVEVGIKFSDDMEMALVVDLVTIKLFRKIEIGDVYGNVKGGQYEMNFHELAPSTKNEEGEPMMNQDILNHDTPLLHAAAVHRNSIEEDKIKMVDEMTENAAPVDGSPNAALADVKQIDHSDDTAASRYMETLKRLERTSVIHEAREKCKRDIQGTEGSNVNENDSKAMRAAVCTVLHTKPTVPHPPKWSIKVTTLQNLSPPYIRRFLHRLPLLLRLLLNPIAYFHPVYIESITAGATGKWAQSMIEQKIFGTTDNSDIKNLQRRISTWLADSNFCVQLVGIKGVAQVPVDTSFDIQNTLVFNDVLVYRALPQQVALNEVVRLGGADATVAVPSFLLPHHEHLLPPRPTKDHVQRKTEDRDKADGKPKTIQAQRAVEQTQRDEANIRLSTHIHLPACFDQQLLDFIAALVKATKLVELDKDAEDLTERHSRSLKDLTLAAKETVKHGLKKATVDAMANDRWIAKLVGKVTKKLETAQGDFGYSGDMPVPLELYRQNAEPCSKLLP